MPGRAINPYAKELLEVRRTLGWMDLVIGAISDAVYVTDSQSRLVFVNQFFANLLDEPRVMLLGQQLDDVFPTSIINTTADDYITSASTTTELDGENVAVHSWRKGGREYIFKIESKRLKATDQIVYFAQDITKEHELFQLKNTFINLASHQLRTPMTAVMTYAHMLHDGYAGPLESNQKVLTRKMMDASERMIKLINDILYITRIQNEDTAFVRQNVSILEIIDTIEAEIGSHITNKKIQFQKTLPPNIPPIMCTRSILYEILSNVILNAVQYTPDGGKVNVSVTQKRDKFTVTISDTGIGIPEDYLSHIYDQFSRADNALEVFNEGTGLGLYLVKILVARINGTIECTSKINKGTTFTLTFPAE